MSKQFFKSILIVVLFILAKSISAGEISDFLDKNVPELLEKYQVSGTVMAIVKGEKVLLKGYGKLGFDRDEPMDAEQTPVYIASLSKLFTALGIMQLYEQGKLSLDIDVNEYLSDFKIKNPYEAPITIHHLLTHTAGLDDRFLGMGAKTKEEVLPLGIYLSRRLPPIVFPPGTAISYSNHGFALLGHIIEKASQKSFDEYMRENIFTPLNMKNSRFDGTYPENLKLPTPYLEYLGRQEEIKMDFAQTPPASSLCTTAEDFSHFLIAMLNYGRYQNQSILKPETVQLMLTPRYKLHSLLPGYACCWEERFINGKRVFQHSGLTWGFSSHTLIIPEERFGVFISINKCTHSFISELLYLLVKHFTLPVRTVENARQHPALVDISFYPQITGFYRHNRYCRSDYFKLATFFPDMAPEIFVRGNPSERTLTVKYLTFPSSEWQVKEIGDMLWGRMNKNGEVAVSPRITFSRSYHKKPYQYVMGNNVYEPIYFWETKLCQYIVFFSCVTVYFINLWRLIYRGLGRLIKSFLGKKDKGCFIDYYQVLTLIFFAYILCFGGYLFLFLKPQYLGYGTPLGLFILLLLPFPIMLLTINGTIRFLVSLKEWSWRLVFELISLLSCYGLLFLLYYWNILDFSMSAWDTLYL